MRSMAIGLNAAAASVTIPGRDRAHTSIKLSKGHGEANTFKIIYSISLRTPNHLFNIHKSFLIPFCLSKKENKKDPRKRLQGFYGHSTHRHLCYCGLRICSLMLSFFFSRRLASQLTAKRKTKKDPRKRIRGFYGQQHRLSFCATVNSKVVL